MQKKISAELRNLQNSTMIKSIKLLILDPGDFVYGLHETIRKGSKKLTDQYNGSFQVIR